MTAASPTAKAGALFREGQLAAATEDWNAGRRFGQVTGTDLPHLVAPDLAGLRLRRPGG